MILGGAPAAHLSQARGARIARIQVPWKRGQYRPKARLRCGFGKHLLGGQAESSSAAQSTLAAIEEINAAATQAVAAAQQSLRKVNAIQQLIGEASTDIESLIEGVSASAKANMESARLVAELERQSAEIGNIVEAVVRIADQTNLLALNAAIEAARAGQHGKGFAVVADEVRNLAETSEKSARDIRDLVEKIQADVKVVVADVERAGKAAQEEVEKARKITEDLKRINQDTREVQRGCEEINTGAKSASEAAASFQQGAQQIATAAEEAAAAPGPWDLFGLRVRRYRGHLGAGANAVARTQRAAPQPGQGATSPKRYAKERYAA